jgi:hypothetical protein
MGRIPKKTGSIGVIAVAQEIANHDLLCAKLEDEGTYPIFDGEIIVYRNKEQRNEDFVGRVPVQIKGKEVRYFSKDRCSYRPVTKSDLMAYSEESGIIFFVVEVLKNKRPTKTKIFLKQLLSYDIDYLKKRIKKNSGAMELVSLDKSDLTLICQNFIRDRKRQKHGEVKSLGEIKGLEGLNLSVITGHFGKGEKALNDYIVAKNPLYLYANAPNGISFPIANLVESPNSFPNESISVENGSSNYGYAPPPNDVLARQHAYATPSPRGRTCNV